MIRKEYAIVLGQHIAMVLTQILRRIGDEVIEEVLSELNRFGIDHVPEAHHSSRQTKQLQQLSLDQFRPRILTEIAAAATAAVVVVAEDYVEHIKQRQGVSLQDPKWNQVADGSHFFSAQRMWWKRRWWRRMRKCGGGGGGG